MPTLVTSAPASLAAAASANELTSYTWPGPGLRETSTNSSPSEMTVSRGRGCTSTLSRPTAASSPTCAAPMNAPDRTATSPGCTSSPVRRTYCPDRTDCSIRTLAPPSGCAPDSGTTASAMVGSGAPVSTYTH